MNQTQKIGQGKPVIDQQIREVFIQFAEGENEGVELRVAPPRTLVLGRSEDCDVYLGEKKISRRHCQIIVEPSFVKVKDLHSTNGTFVNKERIEEMMVTEADEIQLGTTIIKIRLEKDASVSMASLAELADEQNSQVEDLPDLTPEPREEPKEKPAKKPEKAAKEQSAPAPEKKLPQQAKEEDRNDVADPSKEKLDDSLSFDEPSQRADLAEDLEFIESLSEEPSIVRAPSELDDALSRLDEESLIITGEGKDTNEIAALAEPKHTGNLVGSLSAMGLADLLQTFKQNQKTGALVLKKENISAELVLRRGQLIRAQVGSVTGLKAVYRLLAWVEGDFELKPLEPNFDTATLSQDIEGSLEQILMEGFRQVDELNKLRPRLPGRSSRIALVKPLQAPLAKLHPRVLEVLQFVINLEHVARVLDDCPLTDLEINKILLYLLKKNYTQLNN